MKVKKSIHPLSTTWTIAEVASFRRVCERTVRNWMSDKDPKTGEPKGVDLGYSPAGENKIIGEQDVVDLWVREYRGPKGFKPGELEERARRECREFKRLVETESVLDLVADLHRRLNVLEQAGKQPASNLEVPA